jgi:HK97 family phage prohead protease
MQPTLTVPLEIKSLSEREFEGHGSMFGNIDHGGDVVIKGAFRRSLAAHKKANQLPQMFWMHDPSRVPGKWTDMHEDDKGLVVKGVLAPTELGNEVHTLLKMDAVRGLSIGFVTKDQDYDRDGNRLIKEVDLWEVSIVSMPMNPLAQVHYVKSQLSALGEYVPTRREFERIIRDAGCTQLVAKQIISAVFDSPGKRDVEPAARDVEIVESLDEKELRALLASVQEHENRIFGEVFRH